MIEPLFPPDDADEPEEPDDELEGMSQPWADAGDDEPVDDDGLLDDADGLDGIGPGEEGALVGEDGEEHRAVFVSTAIPVALRVAPLDDERAPEGSALGAFIGDRLVARCAMPREAIEQIMEMDLFDEPVPLALLAVEEAPGLQCRLFALVPADRIMDEEDGGGGGGADEPWRASVPSFEDRMAELEDDEDEEDGEDGEDEGELDDGTAVASILLGHIVRFERDRKYSDNLTAEAVDVLQKIVLGGQLQDANARAVDDLLDSL